MSKNTKYYVVINEGTKNGWSTFFWKEASKYLDIHYDSHKIDNKILRKMKKIHYSNVINNRINLPFKFIWDRYISLKLEDLNEKFDNYIIYQSTIKVSPQYIKKVKRLKNTKIILYLPDTIAALNLPTTKSGFEQYKKKFMIDAIYSFDKKDCQTYGFHFFDVYSALKFVDNVEKSIDIFYVGSYREKKRLAILNAIAEYSKNNGLKSIIYLNGVDNNEVSYIHEDIIVNHYINYDEVIDYVRKSKCLVEIMNSGQTGNTLRMKEAICYGCKILTNNKDVVNSKYYNDENIYLFNSVNDLKTMNNAFFKNKLIDYQYHNDFSPIKLLEEIQNI